MASFTIDRAADPASRRRLNILMVGLEWFTDNPGGGGRYLTDAAVGLAARGHRVTVLVPRQHDSLPAAEEIDGVIVERFPLAGRLARVVGPTRAVGPLVAARGPFDVVHSHFALHGLGPLYHPALRSARKICQFQGPWAAESQLEGAGPATREAKYAIERLAYRRCDHFVVLSEAFRDLLERDYAIAPAQVTVIPAAVDTERFCPATDRAALRAELGWGPEPRILAVRRLVKRMGLEVLLAAFARAREQRSELRLSIGGSGPLAAELAARAEALGLGDSVDWLGRLDDRDLVRHYQAADLTVVPTLALEGFGLITVESLACGTPVLGTSEGGTAEILAPLSDSLLVAPGDADGLGDRLLALVNGTRPLPTREACRAYALAHYTWPRVLDRLEDVLAGD